MRKIYYIYIFIIAVLPLNQACAQSYFTSNEFGIAGGVSQYFGDLNENYGFQTIAPAYGIYMRRRMSSYIALKIEGNFTKVGYDDKYNKSVPFEVERNLNFKSNILEVTLQAEFNFFRFITGDKNYRFTPYLTSGIGAFYYNPYTTYKGIRYDLRPLGTEGQNAGYSDRKYSKFSGCIPLGAGVKYWLAPGINLSLEIADRITFTDYLDDVSATYVGAEKFPTATYSHPARAIQDRSTEVTGGTPLGTAGKQRGNSSSQDQYFMALLSISFHFTTYRCPASMNRDYISTY